MTVFARYSAAALVLAVLAPAIGAQGLTVVGHASVPLKADMVEIRGTLKVTAENPATLFANYANARKRLNKALKSVEEQGVTITGSGPRITFGAEMTQAMIMMGAMEAGGQAGEAPQINVSETFTVSIPLGERDDKARGELLATYLEAAQEGGLNLSAPKKDRDMMMMMMLMGQRAPEEGPGPVTWTFSDHGTAEDAAFGAALKDAKVRAMRQAKAAGLALGPISSLKTLVGARVSHIDSAEGSHEIDIEVTYTILD